MEAVRKSQVLEKTNIPCLYRSSDSGILYGIFTVKAIKLKNHSKPLTKNWRADALKHYAKRLPGSIPKQARPSSLWTCQTLVGYVSGMMKPSSRLRRETAINALKPYFTNTVRAIDKSQVDKWAASRNKTASARTFNIERETLIQILDYAMREG